MSVHNVNMISEREIIAIKCCLNPESAQFKPTFHDQAQNLLQCCKSKSEALRLKQDGNDHFRKKKFHTAIHKYTMVGPYSTHKMCVSIYSLAYRQSFRLLGPLICKERLLKIIWRLFGRILLQSMRLLRDCIPPHLKDLLQAKMPLGDILLLSWPLALEIALQHFMS